MTWIPVKELGQGLNKDAVPEEQQLGVGSDALNVRFRNGYTERYAGMTVVYTTPAVVPYHNCNYTVGTTRFMVETGLQKTYVDDGTTQTDITNANNTGSVDDRWCGFVFNGAYIQNNGVDVPQFWGGNTALNLADLTGWPAGYKAGFMRAFGNFIVAGDITRAGVRERNTVLWSASTSPGAIPSSWNIADATKDAGDQPIAETNGNLIDCMPLGDTNVIYKSDSLYYQQPIQSNRIFKFGRFPGDTGLLARGCVTSFPGGHVYLTPGFDVVTHNGQGVQSILDGRMARWLASNINTSYATRSFVVKNPATYEVLVCIPAGSSTVCNKALVWNWKEGTLSIRELPNVNYGSTGEFSITDTTMTWATDSASWASDVTTWGYSDYATNSPRVIFAGNTPNMVLFDSGSQDVGADYTSRFEQIGMHFDEPGKVKLARAVRPKFDAPNGTVIYCQLGGAMTAYSYPTFGDAVPFMVGTDIEITTMVTGRFLGLRFYTTSGAVWRTKSCDIDIQMMGNY